MSQHAMVWLVIIVGGGVSYLFRVLPRLLWARAGNQQHQAGGLRFFDYAAYAVIGGIVASALMGNGQTSLSEQLRDPQVQAGLVAVVVTFLLALYTRRQMVSVLVGLAVYALIWFP